MASSIVGSAFPETSTPAGKLAQEELVARTEEEYEDRAIRLCLGLRYDGRGRSGGRLMEMRKILFEHRWKSPLFDTRRWVRDLEKAYKAVWGKWVSGEDDDVFL